MKGKRAIVGNLIEQVKMSPQRVVSIQQSARILKFFWWLLEDGPNGVTCEYFWKTQNEVTAKATEYNLQEVIDWNPPYIIGVNKLKTLLKCIRSYLSRGNVGGPLDTWIEKKDGDDSGNKEALRTALRGDGDNLDDTVTISFAKASEMLVGLEYLKIKTGLALIADQRLDQYNAEYLQIYFLQN